MGRHPATIGRHLAGACGRYLLTYAAAWLLIGLVPSGETRVTGIGLEAVPLRDSFLRHLSDGAAPLLGIAVPSLLVLVLFGLLNTRTGTAFRVRLAGLLLLPVSPLLLASLLYSGAALGSLTILAAAQILFAARFMPAPLPHLLPRHRMSLPRVGRHTG